LSSLSLSLGKLLDSIAATNADGDGAQDMKIRRWGKEGRTIRKCRTLQKTSEERRREKWWYDERCLPVVPKRW
jgi:hypothetical protein